MTEMAYVGPWETCPGKQKNTQVNCSNRSTEWTSDVGKQTESVKERNMKHRVDK